MMLLLLIASPAYCQLPVFDATSFITFGNIWKEDVDTGIKLANTYNQTLKLVKQSLELYSLEQQMSQRVKSKDAWKPAAFQLGNEYTRSHYNETVNFDQVMNGDALNAAHGWGQATYNAGDGSYLGAATPATSTRMTQFATIQLIDQTSQRCASVLGQYKQTQQDNSESDTVFTNDVLDMTTAKNTMVAALNIMNGGGLKLNTQAKANGNLQACLAEQQTLAAKVQRDKLAAEQDWYAGVAAAKARTNTGLDPDKTLQVNRSYMVP